MNTEETVAPAYNYNNVCAELLCISYKELAGNWLKLINNYDADSVRSPATRNVQICQVTLTPKCTVHMSYDNSLRQRDFSTGYCYIIFHP